MSDDWSDEALLAGVASCRAGVACPIGSPKRRKAEAESCETPRPKRQALSPPRTAQKEPQIPDVWHDHLRRHLEEDAEASTRCLKCRWAAKRGCWLRRTALGSAVARSWLQAKSPNAFAWGVGCKACGWAARAMSADAVAATDIADRRGYQTFDIAGEGLRLSNFKRHATTRAHKEAVVAYLRHLANKGSSGACLLNAVPGVQEFGEAWQAIRLGAGAASSMVKKHGHRKHRSMEWCLFEALRDRELAFLLQATCISISLDERNGRLLMKYSAVGDGLEPRWGCLAICRDSGAHSRDVAAAVLAAVRRFCKRRVLHPGLNIGRRKLQHDPAAADAICSRIEMFTADGASNEQLAGKMLHPTSLRHGGAAGKLPNLRMVLRDKAHASRRLTERTFQADPVLDRIMQVVVVGNCSVARLLNNSRRVQTIFEAEVAKQVRLASATGIQTTARDVGFAKQRFDSTAKPLGRCLLNLDAIISAMDILSRRSLSNSKDGRGSRDFLSFLNERNLILMGMLADASDECLGLTRFFDREAFRLEEMSDQLAAFQRRLRWLFSERGCLSTGFTALALAHLTRAKLVPFPGNVPVTLGGQGANPDVVTECLGRMVAWTRLVEEVSKSEFPEMELLSCFGVFRLALAPSVPDSVPSAALSATKQLHRLAEAFQVDSDGLFDQFAAHQRIAQAEMIEGEPAAAAWRRALQKTQSTSRRRSNFPAGSLRALLQRYVIAPGSTAGIEQNFSRLKRLLGQQWNGSEQAEERRLVLELASAARPTGDSNLLAEARLIWSSIFGPPRQTAPGRLGPRPAVQKQQPRLAQTAAAWLRRRRQQVAVRAAGAPVNAKAEDLAAADAAWTARHQKEARFQQAAQAERRQAAVQEGVLGMDALGSDAAQQMEAFRAKEQVRQANHDALMRAFTKVGQKPAMPNLQGRRVFVDPEAQAVLKRTLAQWTCAQRQARLTVVEDRSVASVFCVLNPSAPGDRIRCVAALSGALVCTPEMLLAPPASGAGVQLQRALAWPRHIFISTACHAKHKVIVDLALRVCQLAPTRPPKDACRWTWYLESDGQDRQALFLARARKRDATHRSELVTLLLPGQLADAAFRPFPNRAILSSFLAAATRVDSSFAHLGFCGR